MLHTNASSLESDSTSLNSETQRSETLIIPIIEEKILVEKERIESGTVTVFKHVEEKLETVDISLSDQAYSIEHIPVNIYIDDALPEARQEGDTMILPVIKEVLVKRWLLVEEVRITKRTTQHTEQQTVTLRKETVTVNRRGSSL